MKISSAFVLFLFTLISNIAYSQEEPQKNLNTKRSTVYVVSLIKESKDVYLYEEHFMSGGLRTKGKIKSEKKRKKFGHWMTYYENRNISQEGEYVNNKKNGTWKWYFESGKVAAIEAYKSGKRISCTFYNENGEQISQEQAEKAPIPPHGKLLRFYSAKYPISN